ncbi:MAG: hypothetical protein ACRD59_12550 [Candidatus Acidiferrales bacterium]
MPWFARPILIILSLILTGTVAWQGVLYALHSRHKTAETLAATPTAPGASTSVGWQRDVGIALDEAVRHASEGDVTQTEMAIDRATSMLSVARMHAYPAPPDFYETVIAKLDQILVAYHENTRLTEHVTLARIELAQSRSALERAPAGAPSAVSTVDLLLPRTPPNGKKAENATPPNSGADGADKAPPGHIMVGAPRTLAAGTKLDPASLGGDFLDATNMPSTSEILEPPSSRLFVDDVRVEGVTIAGATQTIDGVHWKNVTFIGTRLRYEGGEVDLNNVRFIHCILGFTTDERAARIANAIALGRTSIVIE